jgi:hypothetical protein
VAYDKNQNFGPTEQLKPEFKMSLPSPSTYFDVNADSTFTGTALDNLVDYLAQYNKELHKQTVQRFYNERTILRYFLIRMIIPTLVLIDMQSTLKAFPTTLTYSLIKMNLWRLNVNAQQEKDLLSSVDMCA